MLKDNPRACDVLRWTLLITAIVTLAAGAAWLQGQSRPIARTVVIALGIGQILAAVFLLEYPARRLRRKRR